MNQQPILERTISGRTIHIHQTAYILCRPDQVGTDETHQILEHLRQEYFGAHCKMEGQAPIKVLEEYKGEQPAPAQKKSGWFY